MPFRRPSEVEAVRKERLEVADYEFSLVLQQVLSVARKRHFEAAFERDKELKQFLKKMLKERQ